MFQGYSEESEYEYVNVPQGVWINIGDDIFVQNFKTLYGKNPDEAVLNQLATLMGISVRTNYILFTVQEAQLLAKALIVGNSNAELLLDCQQTLPKADKKIKELFAENTKLTEVNTFLTVTCVTIGVIALVAILGDVYFLWRGGKG